MRDRQGREIRSGSAIRWSPDEAADEDGIVASVLDEVGSGWYVIQLQPQGVEDLRHLQRLAELEDQGDAEHPARTRQRGGLYGYTWQRYRRAGVDPGNLDCPIMINAGADLVEVLDELPV